MGGNGREARGERREARGDWVEFGGELDYTGLVLVSEGLYSWSLCCLFLFSHSHSLFSLFCFFSLRFLS